MEKMLNGVIIALVIIVVRIMIMVDVKMELFVVGADYNRRLTI